MSEALEFQVKIKEDFDAAIERVTAELKLEGFGVLTRIDVHNVLKEKLDMEFRRYAILGACNPSLAHRALGTQPLMGLLLPCNVTVEETQGGSLVSIVNPDVLVEPLSENQEVCDVATDARLRLERVAESLGA